MYTCCVIISILVHSYTFPDKSACSTKFSYKYLQILSLGYHNKQLTVYGFLEKIANQGMKYRYRGKFL
jgi:hypothetical protein